jgi:succinate dehydrogenase / fumarate reductase cytochrome b subunit
MRYAYYPGCYAKGTAPELDASTRAVCARLGIELKELAGAPCCGAGDVQHVDGPLAAGLNALVLAQAERLGLDVLTVCNVCTLSLRQADAALRAAVLGEESDAVCLAVADPGCGPRPAAACADAADDAGAAASVVGSRASTHPAPGHTWPVSPLEAAVQARDAVAAEGLSYGGSVRTTHLLWALWRDLGTESLAERATQRLSGLTLAPFYGCQILRPESLNTDDVADDPTALEDVLAACGARSVDYDGRLKCCGWPVTHVRQRTAGTMAARAVRNAAAAGADALVTPCPLCHAALEGCQVSGRSLAGEPLRLPVLHLAQVVGLALGCSPDELRLRHHVVDTKPVLARAGLPLA